jgi:Tol biopolymer transport system component/DNA-binding winged helix-turn-helix (wHTH) protein
MEMDGVERVKFGPYVVDLHTCELWKHGTRLRLVGQPFEILAALLKRPGQLVTREELRAQLWPGDTFVDFNHGLNAAVNKLRDTLCDSAEDPKYIETLPRRGYRFVAQVEAAPPLTASNGAVAWPTHDADTRSDVGPVVEPESLPAAEPVADTKGSISPVIDHPPASRKKWLRRAVTAGAVIAVAWLLVNFGILDHLRATRMESAKKMGEKANLDLIPLTNVPDPTSDAAFSPDGNKVAFRREGDSPDTWGIFVKPIYSSQLVQVTNHREDCCPVWSPDGSMIAFSRFSASEHIIYGMSANGRSLRKLHATSAGTKHGELDWSPDGQSIVFVGESPQGTCSIFRLSLKDLTVRRVTEPPAMNHDWGPAFSPDGQSLSFVRTHESGLPENIMLMPAGGGESRVVLSFYNGILGPPVWTSDGQSILFSAGTEPSLLRVAAFGEGEFKAISGLGKAVWHPAVARHGHRLAVQTSSKTVSVWQADLSSDGKLQPRRVVVTDIGRNEGAQVSPDGTKLVFMSSRSGNTEIWVSDRDGSNPVRLTWMGNVGTPRWSPNGRSVAFDATIRGHGSIYTVDLTGAPPRVTVGDNSNNLVPSWSEDGRWIYFASDRSGIWQVWKVATSGGAPMQVTTHGGFAAYEFHNVIYYSKFNQPKPEVWEVPVGGGVESRVSPFVRPEDWANWALVNGGIYFIQAGIDQLAGVMFYDTARKRVTQVGTLPAMPFWLAATADGKSLLYEHLDQDDSHTMLVENFH